jgi:hypothetical protein
MFEGYSPRVMASAGERAYTEFGVWNLQYMSAGAKPLVRGLGAMSAAVESYLQNEEGTFESCVDF